MFSKKNLGLFVRPMAGVCILALTAFFFKTPFLWSLTILAFCAFIQNMTFTAVSRSRNSGDPSYHRKCAYLSNGVWFVTYFLILKEVWGVLDVGLKTGWPSLVVIAVVYSLFTAEGSVVMMKILLRTEKGKRQVGAR